MTSEAPPFWWNRADWRAWALSPFSYVYGRAVQYRMDTAQAVHVPLPVLCIGNFTVGGSGKTPAAIALAQAATKRGLHPGILSRGHGGSGRKPHLVDPDHDSARHVGDEPMLLAAHAPVAVSPDRAAGAALLQAAGCDFIIMDDGFQSRRIHFDYALVVVDARRGLGNGHVIPGGPLRAPVVGQFPYASGVLVMGEGDAADFVVRMAARAARPIFHARVKPRTQQGYADRKFIAFAGIGDPSKFYDTLIAAGGYVSATRNFGDHHPYTDEELNELLALAKSADAQLITTAKDAVRLAGGTALAREVLDQLEVLEVETEFELPSVPARIIDETLANFRNRKA